MESFAVDSPLFLPENKEKRFLYKNKYHSEQPTSIIRANAQGCSPFTNIEQKGEVFDGDRTYK